MAAVHEFDDDVVEHAWVMVAQFNSLSKVKVSGLRVFGCNGQFSFEVKQFLIVRIIDGFGNYCSFLPMSADKQVVGLCYQYVGV